MSSNDQEAAVLKATQEGYSSYMKWSQEGFPKPLPENLKSLLTDNALQKVLADAEWYGGTGVQVHGDLEITNIQALSVNGKSAVVQLTANDDAITFTVDGKPREKLKNDTRTSKVQLVHDGSWKIDTITEVESHTSTSR
ncbi:hypothetical protein [Psychromicrobium sp. YIM B11713]|uniref:hypothetical protein n=1 Tax=Psychromicrobium sp. YIM B11713 TaxID=3145233 RepID=UPI00374E5F84